MKGRRITTLGDLVNSGEASYQTGPFGTTLKASEYSKNGGVPLISVGEIREGFLQIHDTTPRVCEEVLKRLPKYRLRENDIVFGRKGAIDRNAIINKEQDGWFLGSDGIRLRLCDQYDSTFFSYYLRSKNIGKWLMQNGQGAIMPTLNQKILDRLPLVLPDKTSQTKIADVLSTLDAKIEINHRINQELEGLAKLLYDYWFVQFDFPISAEQAAAMGDPTLQGKPFRQSGGKMTYNPTLKREIPEGWEVKQLSDICRNVRDTIDPTKVDPQTPYVGLEHVPRRAFFLDDWDKASSVGSLKSRFSVGDILFGKLRPYFHKVARADMEGICTSELLVLRPTKAKFEGFMGSLVFSDYFVQSTSKQWGGAQMPRADWNRMKEFKFAVPTDSSILNTFNTLILPLWKQGGANQHQNQELATLRDWLLPMLMSGQVTVAP